ncbi:MAG TPA: 30S ribosome-binding factor RbfA [Anaerolineales bacterium]|nr:30S ribosome-binding factor RbfA [Anaerolineales bacterium]
MTSEARSRRIGTRMQEELAEILLRQVSDPRLEGLIVTGIDVDRELAFATIHVTMAEAEAQKDVMTALIRARGFFRSELARRIALRSFPRLRFRWDASAERGARIEELLASLKADDRPKRGEKRARG